MEQARLLWEVGTEGFGGDEMFLADVNGDGRLEIVTRQSAGGGRAEEAFQRFVKRGAYTAEERRLDCITALDLDGNHLWRLGEPHREDDPFFWHGSGGIGVARLDGGDAADVLAVLWDTLTVLDGPSGEKKVARNMGGDDYNRVVPVALKGDGSRKQVLVKSRRGALVLDSNLSELWPEQYYSGAGSQPVVLDLDGDGYDEILIGYNLVDQDGRTLWTFPMDDPEKEHVDQVNPADLDGDGRYELAYSGSKDFFVVSVEGELIWKREHTHAQSSIAGRFREDVDGLTVLLNEKWIGMTCYTPKGEKLWFKEGVGYGRHTVRGWGDGGLDLVVYEPHLKKEWSEVPYYSIPEDTAKYWPYLIDGDGNKVMELPWKDDYVQPRQRIRGFRAYDYGIVYHVKVIDVDGDGRDEIVVWDRRRVMAFGAPR